MGDPRRSRKKYKKPKRLWDKERIDEESKLKKDYGLKATRELWIATEELRRVRREARKLLALGEEERAKSEKRILDKLARLNISANSLDDVLSLTVRDFLERRLQTLVYRKGLAKTPKQARQLIVHGFIAVDGVKQLSPGRFVRSDEEDKITYYKPIDLEKKVEEDESKETSESNKEESNQDEAKGESQDLNNNQDNNDNKENKFQRRF